MPINRIAGILVLAFASTVGGGAAFADGQDGSAGKSAGPADQHTEGTASTDKTASLQGHECGKSAEQCAEQMRKDAQSHGWLGVSLDLSADGQMRITRVWPGSPAERAGFQLDDRVVSMNGVDVGEKQLEKLFSLMRDAKIGDKMTFTVARGPENLSLHATLGKIPDDVLAENIEKHMQESHKVAKN